MHSITGLHDLLRQLAFDRLIDITVWSRTVHTCTRLCVCVIANKDKKVSQYSVFSKLACVFIFPIIDCIFSAFKRDRLIDIASPPSSPPQTSQGREKIEQWNSSQRPLLPSLGCWRAYDLPRLSRWSTNFWDTLRSAFSGLLRCL